MKKTFVFTLTILSLLLVCGCHTKNNNIRIGGLFALSGGAAAYGEDLKKGTELALEEINASNPDFKLELIAKDTKSDRSEAVKACEDLISINRVSAILGPTTSPNALVIGRIADQYSIPLIVQAATQNEVTKSNEYQRKFVTKICFNDEFQGRALADFAFKDLQKEKAVIIFDNSVSYSVGLAESFEKRFVENGGTIVSKTSYSVEQKDFRALIEKISLLETKANLLFIPGWDENVGPMLRQSENKWKNFVVLGGDGLPTDKFIELSGGNLNNVFALAHYNPNSDDTKVKNFVAAYKTKYNTIPSPHAALGYDAVYVLYEAIKSCNGNVTPNNIMDNLRKIKEIELVSGQVSFDETGDAIKSGVILQITKNGYEYIKTIK